MLVKVARVEITGEGFFLNHYEALKKDMATFGEIILSIATQCSLLEFE